MKISILTPDLSHNCLGRAYLLAKVLQRHYEVEIVGPVFGDGIWGPVANDKSITIKSVKIRGKFKPYWQILELLKKTDGDVIYASKPLFASFGIGLLLKFLHNKPLILDIDDWEMGFTKEAYRSLSPYRRFRFLISSIVYIYNIGSYWNKLVGEKLIRFADKITISNNFLKEKFGGTIVQHARNTDVFDPGKFDKNLMRERYHVEEAKKVVIFFGTPRDHKGINDLINAMALNKNDDLILVVVGIDDRDQYCKNLVKTANKTLDKRFKGFALQPFEKVPEFLSMADLVVIPQKKNFATIGQTPAKVFDAMAMAKPIVATNVSDLPEILDGCGWIVEPENPKQLAETIQYILDNYNEALDFGRKARQKCIKEYSWDAIENVLIEIFEKYK